MSAAHEEMVEVDNDLPPGTVLGRGKYRIESSICSGGFGIVYRARDRKNTIFAIKEFFVDGVSIRGADGSVLSPTDYASEIEELMLLFSEEGWWPSLLSHPNVLRVLGYFEENSTGYIVLEYIAGADLQDIMEHHPDWLEPRQIVQIATMLCEGLQYLHQNGVVHGDISPDNVIIRGPVDPVLIDFGSSLFHDDNGPRNRAPAKMRAVKEGYSPPELYDRYVFPSWESDIYSLGATLYHMVVGAAPDGKEVGVNKPTVRATLASFSNKFDRRFLQVISSALSTRQEERPTAADISQVCRYVLAHPDSSSQRLH